MVGSDHSCLRDPLKARVANNSGQRKFERRAGDNMTMMEPINSNAPSSSVTATAKKQTNEPRRTGLTGRLMDTALFQHVKGVVEDVSSTGTQWFSKPLQQLKSIVTRISHFLGLGMLSAFMRREEKLRDERQAEVRELEREDILKANRQIERRQAEHRSDHEG